MRLNSYLVALAVPLVVKAVTFGPVGSLEIVNLDIDPDDYPRPAVLANGTFPGPTLVGKKGDRFTINVTNSLNDPRMLQATSIVRLGFHWHGIFQNGTNFADGAAMVNQCPIVPNASFVYNFTAQDQVGTYWYHSHYSTQYCDGLRGAMVIYDPEDPYLLEYDVDDESTIITLADWIHVASPTPMNSNDSLSTLVNGLGRTIQNEVTLNTLTPLSVIDVIPGQRYRFRVIGLSCDAPFNFTIHNHTMTIIETDGQYTTPLVVDSLWVYAGQRYSIIVTANQPVDNYWVRADPLGSRGFAGFDNGRNSAILRYKGAPDVEPSSTGISTLPLNEDDLRALFVEPVPGKHELGGADIVVPIVQTWHEDHQVFDINNVTYASPSVPVLLQILNGATPKDLMPQGSVYSLKANSSVELQIHGISKGGPHPYHLHGHSFWVIKNADSDVYNWVNPPKRDVVSTGLDGNLTVIRFFTDNAGPWFLHCHIDWHIELGLAIVFAEDVEHTAEHLEPIPQSFKDLCPAYSAFNPDEALLNVTEAHP
ncbi:hypothetical protein H0H87_000662 [Tephrocybe sp. NHM501043]|nr:hypothetical protein H0H87_000662 [Tephrocybe sp. NHM501043]